MSKEKKVFDDFYEAYHFLYRHEIFDGDYASCLDVLVMKVDPDTDRVEEDREKNTKTQVWFESGPEGCHDLGLDCGGDTYEEATIKLANLVAERYGMGQVSPKPVDRELIF